MMPEPRRNNGQMFWRIVRRLLGANRGRLFVILLALGAGAAVTAALLNLQVDAKRRLTTEFRVFGPNVVIGPREAVDSDGSPHFLDESMLKQLPDRYEGAPLAYAAYLYGVVDIATRERDQRPAKTTRAILAGFFHAPPGPSSVVPAALVGAEERVRPLDARRCEVGQKVATILELRTGDEIGLTSGNRKDACQVYELSAMGGPEDSQVFLELAAAQALLEQTGRISLMQLRLSGTPQQIQDQVARLEQGLPGVDVRPIRQFTEGEAKIYSRISSLLTATVVMVLLLTSLCVMAAILTSRWSAGTMSG